MQISVCRRATTRRARNLLRSLPPRPHVREAGPGYVTGGGASRLPRTARPTPRRHPRLN